MAALAGFSLVVAMAPPHVLADGGAATKAKYARGDDGDDAVITENRGLLNFGKGKEGDDEEKKPKYDGGDVDAEDPKTRIFTDNPELNSGIVGFGLGLGGALLAGALLDNAQKNQDPCHAYYRYKRDESGVATRGFFGLGKEASYRDCPPPPSPGYGAQPPQQPPPQTGYGTPTHGYGPPPPPRPDYGYRPPRPDYQRPPPRPDYQRPSYGQPRPGYDYRPPAPLRDDYRQPNRDGYQPPRDYSPPNRNEYRPPYNDKYKTPREDYRDPHRDEYRDDYRNPHRDDDYRAPYRDDYRPPHRDDFRLPDKDDFRRPDREDFRPPRKDFRERDPSRPPVFHDTSRDRERVRTRTAAAGAAEEDKGNRGDRVRFGDRY